MMTILRLVGCGLVIGGVGWWLCCGPLIQAINAIPLADQLSDRATLLGFAWIASLVLAIPVSVAGITFCCLVKKGN